MLGNQQNIVNKLNQEWQDNPVKMDALAARMMGIDNGYVQGAFNAVMNNQQFNNENNAHVAPPHQ